MDRELLAKFWDDAWNKGLWTASWKQSVDGLTPERAAWKHDPARHSVWQIASHVIYWREVQLRRFQNGPEPTKDEVARLNFPDPKEPTESVWKETLRRLEDTQGQFAAAIANPKNDMEKLAVVLAHDCYHFGQINYVRALAGLKPIE